MTEQELCELERLRQVVEEIDIRYLKQVKEWERDGEKPRDPDMIKVADEAITAKENLGEAYWDAVPKLIA